MKFHLDINENGKAACGAVINRPDTFIYNEESFTSHFATEYRCKKCQEILDKFKTNVQNIQASLENLNHLL